MLVGEAPNWRAAVVELTAHAVGDLGERRLVHGRMEIRVQDQPALQSTLVAAKARLDRLAFYPAPVRIERVRVFIWPWLFHFPWLRRFDGYAAWNAIFLRRSLEHTGVDLLTHELCHVWQMQHRPLAMPLSYLRHGYAGNRYEEEARRAVAETARPGGQA